MGFFIFSISAISSLLNYFALGRYILSKTLMFLVLGGERPRGEETFNLPFQRGFDFIGGCKYIVKYASALHKDCP